MEMLVAVMKVPVKVAVPDLAAALLVMARVHLTSTVVFSLIVTHDLTV